MQLRSALLAATVLATPIAASAQPVTGLYVGAGAGVNIMQRTSRSTPTRLFGVGTANLNVTKHRVCRCGEHGLGLRQRSAR